MVRTGRSSDSTQRRLSSATSRHPTSGWARCASAPDCSRRQVRLFATRRWHLGFTGDPNAASQSFCRAGEALREAPRPDGEVFLAMMHTDVLLHHGRPPADCVEALERALLHIRELDLRSAMTNIVRANVGEAWM